MINRYSIKWLRSAKSDIAQIQNYIDENFKSRQIAVNILTNIQIRMNILKVFPYSCPKINDTNLQEFRKLVIDNYIAFYKVDDTKRQVVIHRVIYAAREYGKLL